MPQSGAIVAIHVRPDLYPAAAKMRGANPRRKCTASSRRLRRAGRRRLTIFFARLSGFHLSKDHLCVTKMSRAPTPPKSRKTAGKSSRPRRGVSYNHSSYLLVETRRGRLAVIHGVEQHVAAAQHRGQNFPNVGQYEVGIYSPALYSHGRPDKMHPPTRCNNRPPLSPRDTSPETLPGR